jgi:hypothetical protein
LPWRDRAVCVVVCRAVQVVDKASKACSGICMWVRAMYKYYTVALQVEPKKKRLAEAQESLDRTMAGAWSRRWAALSLYRHMRVCLWGCRERAGLHAAHTAAVRACALACTLAGCRFLHLPSQPSAGGGGGQGRLPLPARVWVVRVREGSPR